MEKILNKYKQNVDNTKKYRNYDKIQSSLLVYNSDTKKLDKDLLNINIIIHIF